MTKIKHFFRSNLGIAITLFAIFLIGVVSKWIFLDRLGAVIFAKSDERIFIELARSFHYEHRFNLDLFDGTVIYYEILYPVILSLAYYFYSPEKIISIMRWIGVILMTSAVFPAYLLGKNIGRSKFIGLFTALIAVLLPEMTYSFGILQEVIFYPMVLWVLVAVHSRVKNDRPYYWMGVLFYVLWITKAIGQIAIIPYLGLLLYLLVMRSFDRKIILEIAVILISFLLLRFLHIFVIGLLTDSFGPQKEFYLVIISRFFSKGLSEIVWLSIYGMINYIFYVIVTFLFLPIAILPDNLFSFDKGNRQFLLFTFAYLLISIGVVVFTITPGETNISSVYFRFHGRYLFFLFIPILALFLSLREKKSVFGVVSLALAVFVVVYFWLQIKNLKIAGSVIDSKMLEFFNFIFAKPKGAEIISTLVVLGMALITYFVLKGKQITRIGSTLLMVGILGLVGISGVYSSFYTAYYFGDIGRGRTRQNDYVNLLKHLDQDKDEIVIADLEPKWLGSLATTHMRTTPDVVNTVEELYSVYTNSSDNTTIQLIFPKNSKFGLYGDSKFTLTPLESDLFNLLHWEKYPGSPFPFMYFVGNSTADGWFTNSGTIYIFPKGKTNSIELSLTLGTVHPSSQDGVTLTDDLGNASRFSVSGPETTLLLLAQKSADDPYFTIKLKPDTTHKPSDFGNSTDNRDLSFVLTGLEILSDQSVK